MLRSPDQSVRVAQLFSLASSHDYPYPYVPSRIHKKNNFSFSPTSPTPTPGIVASFFFLNVSVSGTTFVVVGRERASQLLSSSPGETEAMAPSKRGLPFLPPCMIGEEEKRKEKKLFVHLSVGESEEGRKKEKGIREFERPFPSYESKRIFWVCQKVSFFQVDSMSPFVLKRLVFLTQMRVCGRGGFLVTLGCFVVKMSVCLPTGPTKRRLMPSLARLFYHATLR